MNFTQETILKVKVRTLEKKLECYEKALQYYATQEALRTPFQREIYGMIATKTLKE